MDVTILPLPAEPIAIKQPMRTLLEAMPEEGQRVLAAGEWIADLFWSGWREALVARGMGRERFLAIVVGYRNELRLWVMGERPWDQCASGLAGRVVRRLPDAASEPPRDADPGGHRSIDRPSDRGRSPRQRRTGAWREALGRVGLSLDADPAALTATLADLRLLYEVGIPSTGDGGTATYAIVWAGGRPRDPEVPFGEGVSDASETHALAEALGRFLVKDPEYPPRR